MLDVLRVIFKSLSRCANRYKLVSASTALQIRQQITADIMDSSPLKPVKAAQRGYRETLGGKGSGLSHCNSSCPSPS